MESLPTGIDISPPSNYRETVNEVIASKEVFQLAGELLMRISQDEREQAIFRSRRMYQTDLESDLATAEDRGKQKGRNEQKLEIARNALKMNIPVDDITKLTGLTPDEVKNLRI